MHVIDPPPAQSRAVGIRRGRLRFHCRRYDGLVRRTHDLHHSLDQPTHSLILNDLAACLAREAASGVLNESDFAILQPTQATTSHSTSFLSATAVRTHLAQARFASATADAVNASPHEMQEATHTYLERVAQSLFDLADQLPDATFDEGVQVQGQWPLPDELTYTVMETLLKIGRSLPSTQARVMSSAAALVDRIGSHLTSTSTPDAVLIARTVPQLHGLARALQDVSFTWDSASVAPLVSSMSSIVHDAALIARLDALLMSLPEQEEAVRQCRAMAQARGVTMPSPTRGGATNSTSSPMTFQDRLLEHYAHLGTPLSGHLVAWCALSVLTSLLAQAVHGVATLPTGPKAYASTWKALVEGAPQHRVHVRETSQLAMHTYQMLTAAAYSPEMASPLHAELYVCEALCTALKASVLSVAAGASVDEGFVLEIVQNVLSEQAPLQDARLQHAALDGVAILARAKPAWAVTLVQHLRRWVQLPLPLLEADAASGSPLLTACASSMATCMSVSGKPDLATSTTYSLLNHLSRESTHASPAIVASTLAVVTRLARHMASPSFTSLVTSLLLQRLEGHGRLPTGLVLTHLVPLALASPCSSFVNVLTAMAEGARIALREGGGPLLHAVQTAFLTLARGLTPEAEARGRAADEVAGEMTRLSRKELALPELLALIVDAGLRTQGGRSQAAAAVDSLVPVLAALLAHDDFHVHWHPSDDVVYLFRNAWVVMTLCGHQSSAELVAPLPRGDALSIIALKTPTLIPESSRNYLDDDIETHTVLKQDTLGATPEILRRALKALLGVRPVEGHNLSLVRLAFLQAVLEVEWRRAACGRPSMALWYFVHPSVSQASVHEALQAIAERSFGAFLVHVSTRAEAHAVDQVVVDEVRNILLATCHTCAAVRAMAHEYLERLVPACPSLFVRPDTVVTMLELVTMLGRACDSELAEAFLPQYSYHSHLANVSIDVSDVYAERRAMLDTLLARVRAILTRVQEDMPNELRGSLIKYLQDDAAADSLGASLALDVARGAPSRIGATHVRMDQSGPLAHALLVQGATQGVTAALSASQEQALKAELATALHEPPVGDVLDSLLYRGTALAVSRSPLDLDLVTFLVLVPFRVGTTAALRTATQVWTWLLAEQPSAMLAVVTAISQGWMRTTMDRVGLYSTDLNQRNPMACKTDMSAYNREEISMEERRADDLFTGHMLVLSMLSDCLASAQSHSAALVSVLAMLVQHMADATSRLSTHVLTRLPRLRLVQFGLHVLHAAHVDVLVECRVRDGVCRMALDWFAYAPAWSYGGNLHRGANELRLLRSVSQALHSAMLRADSLVTTATVSSSARLTLHSAQPLTPQCTLAQALTHIQDVLHLLQQLYDNEHARLLVWLNPTNTPQTPHPSVSVRDLHTAWKTDARVAVYLVRRFADEELKAELTRLVQTSPHRVLSVPDALPYLLGTVSHAPSKKEKHAASATPAITSNDAALHWLHMWSLVVPVEAIRMLQPEHGGTNPLVLQYAMRALEEHPVELVFFYVPQVVQALRDDEFGYVALFILKTSLVSQLFCHQIIWNMNANKFKDDNGEVEDSLKPTLDRMVDAIVAQLSGEAQAFYEREFSFFNEVTDISGKLKPYIKKSKPEKKAKIDEEMAKIKVAPDVYLPSNPDGVVIDLDRKSGRPLQSAAKAPFMATFKVRRPVAVKDAADPNAPQYVDVWQSAIFKVGDDCRQDVLALQVIAQFKNIFTSIGLDVYLDPYRVTATAPGCGVIDVVPNATSRDEMGRQKINDLLDFFRNRYGNETSIAFQRARLNFIQSMAAYSVVCHILQIRDRHNGNMMIDGDGHIVHIDFGFLFDIGPGGMRFEPYSFKLSHEMVAVMGGHKSPGFAMFEQLVVKAFLSCRPYADDIVATCALMLGTDLPSFKGKPTLDRLRARFKPELTELEAAAHASWLVKDAHGNMRGTLYDLIQEKQNNIPYRR